MNILHQYQNGNAKITLWEDGTKETEWPDNEPLMVEYPTSCDLKITNNCDMDRVCLYCFAGNMGVQTLDNNTIKIKYLRVGDKVWSFNEMKQKKELRRVEKLFEREIDEDIMEFVFANDNKILVTGNHKFYTTDGMVRADELTVEHILYSFNNDTFDKNKLTSVKSIRKIHHKGKVYNITVEHNHNYYVNDCLVSNCHEMSNPSGKHGDLEFMGKLVETAMAGQEFALGGGNTMSHPNIEKFLRTLANNGCIPNITINSLHIKKQAQQLRDYQNDKLVYGVGISYRGLNSLKQMPMNILYDNVVFHMILGLHSLEDVMHVYNWCKDNSIKPKILMLGYKSFGNGTEYKEKNPWLVEQLVKWKTKDLRKMMRLSNVTLSFDNLAIEQLELQKAMDPKQWDLFYQGNDGTTTFYMDAVTQICARTSTSSERFKLEENNTMKEVFNKVRVK